MRASRHACTPVVTWIRAVVQVDDVLLAVNGHDVRGKSVAQVTALFVGPTGTTVTLRAMRPSLYSMGAGLSSLADTLNTLVTNSTAAKMIPGNR
jgi:hypothetical protein